MKTQHETNPNAEIKLVEFLPIGDICPSPENDTLYRPFDPTDPENIALAHSIVAHGVKEPIVLTLDNFILSGHRRYGAAKLAGLRQVPVRQEAIYHADEKFVQLLREYNLQREKTDSERLREEIVSANPEEAHQALREYRQRKAQTDLATVAIIGTKTRAEISAAKMPFLNAIIKVINDLRNFWPLSIRQIHYQLLNNPPLIHASKPDSRYQNQQKFYESCSELATRARLEGHISMNAIADETRPVLLYTGYETTRPFLRYQFDNFLQGYYRDLQQSQPNHIEILGEKNTVQGVLKPIAMEYCIPMTIGRGYSSLPPRYEMAQRYRRSGKEKLILLVCSDFDPDGEEICHSFARSMRDDFDICRIEAVKVGLTFEQVKSMSLPPSMDAKPSSSNFKKFEAKFGTDAYELEALSPTTLQDLLRQAIDSVLDMDAYNAEIKAETHDAAHLDRVRRVVNQSLQETDRTLFEEELDLSDFSDF